MKTPDDFEMLKVAACLARAVKQLRAATTPTEKREAFEALVLHAGAAIEQLEGLAEHVRATTVSPYRPGPTPETPARLALRKGHRGEANVEARVGRGSRSRAGQAPKETEDADAG